MGDHAGIPGTVVLRFFLLLNSRYFSILVSLEIILLVNFRAMLSWSAKIGRIDRHRVVSSNGESLKKVTPVYYGPIAQYRHICQPNPPASIYANPPNLLFFPYSLYYGKALNTYGTLAMQVYMLETVV